MRRHVEFVNIHMDWSFTMLVGTLNDNYTVWWAICHIISIGTSFKSMSPKQLMWCTHTAGQETIVTRIQLPGIDVTCQVIYGDLEKYRREPLLPNIDNENASNSNSNVLTSILFVHFEWKGAFKKKRKETPEKGLNKLTAVFKMKTTLAVFMNLTHLWLTQRNLYSWDMIFSCIKLKWCQSKMMDKYVTK